MGKIIDKIDIDIALLEEKKKLLGYAGMDRVISSEEKNRELLGELAAGKEAPKFLTKIPLLDDIVEGFRVGTVNVVSGPTGEGKTSYLQTLTKNFAEAGIRSAWFSFEIMPSEFFSRFGDSIPLFYLPKEIPEKSNTMSWIRERILEAQAKYDAKVVFVDHLHYLQDMQGLSGMDNTSLYIGDIMRKLKRLSISLEIAIFLVVHVKSDAGNQAELKKYYTKDDIRDSSFVKQEADTVMMIWRKRKKADNEIGWEYSTASMLNLDKHRRTGKVGFLKMEHKDHIFYESTSRTDSMPSW